MKFFRYWPCLVPVVFFCGLCVLQPADCMVVPGAEPPAPYLLGNAECTRLATDDCDAVAYFLRAENAARGRKAGLVGPIPFDPVTGARVADPEPDQPTVTRVAAYEPLAATSQAAFDLSLQVPAELTERYFLEYPPAALGLFRLELALAGRSPEATVSPALLDANQVDVALHHPATDGETSFYRAFRRATRVHAALMLAALIGMMLLFDRGVGTHGTARGPMWLLILPGVLYFTPCRFDILPAALAVAAVAAADRRKVVLSGVCLGLAVALKLYPLVLAPILLRYVSRDWRDAITWCGSVAVPLVLSYGGMIVTDGIDGILVPLKFQLGRDPEPGWAFLMTLLPPEWTARQLVASVIRLLPVAACALACCVTRPRDVFGVLRRCAISVVVFIAVQVFYSPQWWLWLAVFLIPLIGRHRWLLPVCVGLDVLAYAHFPVTIDAVLFGGWSADVDPIRGQIGYAAVVGNTVLRFALWTSIVVALGRAECVSADRSLPPLGFEPPHDGPPQKPSRQQ